MCDSCAKNQSYRAAPSIGHFTPDAFREESLHRDIVRTAAEEAGPSQASAERDITGALQAVTDMRSKLPKTEVAQRKQMNDIVKTLSNRLVSINLLKVRMPGRLGLAVVHETQ
eukprot:Lithocolla_globosa_v1_NODE_321_length_4507_cov_50.556877.p4 type:complete len:113 gc:universal NODE_321_length_4507_cov_50.556877:3596-3934(+)